jgi:hypothetical protein
MKPPIFVRTLSREEREALEAGLRSSDAFVLRRCQILLASARGERPPRIAENLGCGSQTVRNAPSTPSTAKAWALYRLAPRVPERGPRGLRRERGPDFTRDAPPGPQEVRQREQFVDPTDGRRGQLRRGDNRQRAQWRNHPGYFGASRGAVGTGQALDREP